MKLTCVNINDALLKWFIYCEAEYANSTSVSNLREPRPLWVTYSHAPRVWVHRNAKHTHTHTELCKC